jgi:hypothetical protein
LDHYVTDVNPDPKLKVALHWRMLVRLRNCLLDLYRALDSIHDTRELG